MLRYLPLLVLVFSCCLATASRSEPGRDMPPLPEDRADIYEFYRLEFMEDGYPGRRTETGVVAHPMYGAYVALDYSRLYRQSGEAQYLEAMEIVLQAAIDRMEKVGDGLAFYFEEADALAYVPGRFYSGLVQARYLTPLGTAYQLTGDQKYIDAIDGVLASLRVPVEEGGVALETPFGPTIEEYPHEVPTFVLNGWTTIIRELVNYGERFDDNEALDLARLNLRTVERLLPLYDVPDVANTRYQLAGFIHHRFVLARSQACRINGFEVEIAGERFASLVTDTNRWHNFVMSSHLGDDGFADHRTLVSNIVMSRISYPQPNVVHYDIECREETAAEYSVAEPIYDPSLAGMPTRGWADIETISLKEGRNSISVSVEWDELDMLGYPTNFAKTIGGKNYNVYHYLHLSNLIRLYEFQPSDVIRTYLDRWIEYVGRWPDMEIYSDFELTCVAASQGRSCPTWPADRE